MTSLRPTLLAHVQLIARLTVLLALLVAIHGLARGAERTWPNLLLDSFYLMSLAVSALFFIATQRLSGARWSASLRRIPEALMLLMPIATALMLFLYFGRSTLFPWSRPGFFEHDTAVAGRVDYLKLPFLLARTVVSLAAWCIFAWVFRRISLEQDRNARLSLVLHHRLNKYAAVFVLVFAFTFTAVTYDWVISLDPYWFSTMFAVYIFAGTFVQGIAAVTIAMVLLSRHGSIGDTIDKNKLHDLGKMLFAFSIFWSYIWTCQYLLIWYGNIPEEVTHYVERTRGAWVYLFALNPILNGLVPFVGLMSARSKCQPRVLLTVGGVLLIGHWLDLYLQIMPSLWQWPQMGFTELCLAAGCFALAFLGFVRNLRKAPLVPTNDPMLVAQVVEALHARNMRRWGLPG